MTFSHLQRQYTINFSTIMATYNLSGWSVVLGIKRLLVCHWFDTQAGEYVRYVLGKNIFIYFPNGSVYFTGNFLAKEKKEKCATLIHAFLIEGFRI